MFELGSSTWWQCRHAGCPHPSRPRCTPPTWCGCACRSTWNRFYGSDILTSSQAHRPRHTSWGAWWARSPLPDTPPRCPCTWTPPSCRWRFCLCNCSSSPPSWWWGRPPIYIYVVMVRGLNKEGVSGKLWVVIANWKSIHNQYSIIFQFLHDKLFWQKRTFL